MMPNSFLIEVNSKVGVRSGGDQLSGSVNLKTNKICERFIQIKELDERFALFIGEYTATPFETTAMSAGTLIEYSPEKHKLLVQCDRLGTGILFWKATEGSFLISNRLENLVTADSQPDWSSVQQYLHTGYTVSDRTFYTDTRQTLPNTILEVDARTSSVSVCKRDVPKSHGNESRTNLLIAIEEQLTRRLSKTEPSTLMMSAGWDSRTLLLSPEAIKSCYSHGDLSSRELTLTRSLSGSMRKDHLFIDTQNCSFDCSFIDSMLESLGYGIFPIWFSAAQNIQAWTGSPMMSGVLGELLGGHYGLMAWGTRLQKALSSFLLVSESIVTDDQIIKAVNNYAEPPKSHWFISTEGQDVLDEYRTETKDRVLESIEGQKRESGSWQRTLEDFNMGHRARQYILKQPQAASTTVGYTLPFADEHLTDLVRNLDFEQRVHNKANREILQRSNPSLLKSPMAATLIPARHPIILQELSRIVRIAGEQLRSMVGKTPRRLGWFNYEHLYSGNTLHEIADSLIDPIWDKGLMHQTLINNPQNHIDAGSTLDMICKLKTVDHYLQYLNSAKWRSRKV